MIKHIIKSGWIALRSEAFFSIITILSLAVGCAAALLVGAYLREELSFESWVPHVEDVARIETTLARPGAAPRELAYSASGLAPIVARGAPCIEAQTRVLRAWYTVGIGDQRYNHPVSYVDPTLFEIFPMPALYGDPVQTLLEPSSVILSQAVAEKFFGTTNPIGQTIRLMPFTDVRVGAVLKALPRTTQLEFDIIAPMTVPARIDPKEYEANISRPNAQYFVRAKPGQAEACFATVTSIGQATMQKRLDAMDDRGTRAELVATPIVDIHLSPAKTYDYSAHGDPGQLALFAAVALLILVVSAFNYVTLSLARAVNVAKEMGMRKALGATPIDIALHYLGGSFIVTGIAVLLGFALAELTLPWFALSIGRELTMASLHEPGFLGAAALGSAVLALAVGFYPAIYLARQPAATALKGEMAGGRGLAFVNQGLLLLQLATATVMLCFVFAMMAQAQFVADQPLGFDRANRMVLVGVNYGPDQTPKRFETFKRLATNKGGVHAVTAANALPSWNFDRKAKLRAPDLPLTPEFDAVYLNVDLDFFSAMQVRLLAGRSFDEKYARDRVLIDTPRANPDLLSVIVSRETAQRFVGPDYAAVVGQIISLDAGKKGRAKRRLSAWWTTCTIEACASRTNRWPSCPTPRRPRCTSCISTPMPVKRSGPASKRAGTRPIRTTSWRRRISTKSSPNCMRRIAAHCVSWRGSAFSPSCWRAWAYTG